jgi:hypothetical protein
MPLTGRTQRLRQVRQVHVESNPLIGDFDH